MAGNAEAASAVNTHGLLSEILGREGNAFVNQYTNSHPHVNTVAR